MGELMRAALLVAPNRFEISTDNAKIVRLANASGRFTNLPLSIPIQALQAGSANLKVRLNVYYCRKDNTGACLIKTLVWQIPLRITAAKKTASVIELNETLTLPR